MPVVSVFLSGRPLWVSPELDAGNAFVAAWLPGSEGGGIADVLLADAAGKPRHDFTGTLSFAWPNGAQPVRGPLNAAACRAQFPLGFGLSYARAVQRATGGKATGGAATTP